MTTSLIIGDIHLGAGLNLGRPGIGSRYNSRVSDQVNLLEWITSVAEENYVHDVILTGDIFEDVKPDYVLVNIFLEFLNKLRALNIETHVIMGNHDLSRMGSYYSSVLDFISSSEIPLVHFYKNIETLNYKGVSYTFAPFRDRLSLEVGTLGEAINKVQKVLGYETIFIPEENVKVLIGHLALKGSMPVGDELGDEINEIMCPMSLFEEYDYVWMGHVHKPQVLNKTPRIAHIGSLDISDFGETDHKKIVVLFNPTWDEKFKEIEVPSRPLRRLRVDIPDNVDATSFLIEKIDEEHKNTNLKSSYTKLEIKYLSPDIPGVDRKRIAEYLKKLKVFHISGFAETRAPAKLIVNQAVLKDDILPKDAIPAIAKTLGISKKKEKDFNEYAFQILAKYNLKKK